MNRAVFYKEWIKLRMPMFFMAIGVTAVLTYLFLSLFADARTDDLPLTWLKASFVKPLYFEAILYLFPIVGCIVALFQYLPESAAKRIKLAFHLPENELRITLYHIFFALSFYLAISLYVILVFIWQNSTLFPWQITIVSTKFMVLYILYGIIVYFFVSAIILENVLKYRILYSITASIVLYLIFTRNILAFEAVQLIQYLFVVILSFFFLIFTAVRFYKGLSN